MLTLSIYQYASEAMTETADFDIAMEKVRGNDELDLLYSQAKELRKHIRKTKDKSELANLKSEYNELVTRISRLESEVKNSDDPQRKAKYRRILTITAGGLLLIGALVGKGIYDRHKAGITDTQRSVDQDGKAVRVDTFTPNSPTAKKAVKHAHANNTIIDVDFTEVETATRNVRSASDLRTVASTVL